MEETATTNASELLQRAESVLAEDTAPRLTSDRGHQQNSHTEHQLTIESGHQVTTGTNQLMGHRLTMQMGHQLITDSGHQLNVESRDQSSAEPDQLTGHQLTTQMGHQLITSTEHQLYSRTEHQPVETSSHLSGKEAQCSEDQRRSTTGLAAAATATTLVHIDQHCSQQAEEEQPPILVLTQDGQPLIEKTSSLSVTAPPTMTALSLSEEPMSDEDPTTKCTAGPLYNLAESQLIQVDSTAFEALVKCEVEEGEVDSWIQCEGMEGQRREVVTALSSHQDVVERQTEGGDVMQVVVKSKGKEQGDKTSKVSPKSSGTSSRWSHMDTLKLIQLYKENCHYFTDKQYKKKTVWAMLAGKLARSSKSKLKFTSMQVYNRWKNLTKMYRDCLDDIHRAGTWVGKCRFFDELASVHDTSTPMHLKSTAHRKIRKRRHDRAIKPASSSQSKKNFRPIAPKGLTAAIIQPSASTGQGPSGLSQNCGEERGATARGTGLEEVVKAVQKLHEDQRAVDEWKLDRLQQMHQEKMQMFSKFLDILKDYKK